MQKIATGGCLIKMGVFQIVAYKGNNTIMRLGHIGLFFSLYVTI